MSTAATAPAKRTRTPAPARTGRVSRPQTEDPIEGLSRDTRVRCARSEAQKAASRANGAKSRGPKTAAGKRRSSRNSTRHGLYSQSGPIIAPHHARRIKRNIPRRIQGYSAAFPPQTPYEVALIELIAYSREMVWFFRALETEYYNRGVAEIVPAIQAKYSRPLTHFEQLASVCDVIQPQLTSIYRQEFHYLRIWRKILWELVGIRDLRERALQKCRIEPKNFEPQVSPAQEDTPKSTLSEQTVEIAPPSPSKAEPTPVLRWHFMQLCDIFLGLGEPVFAQLLRTVSIGKLKTFQLYERMKIRFHVAKLNSETLRKAEPRFWARINDHDEEFATELSQAILVSHLDMIKDVVNALAIPNQEGFFEKDIDGSKYLTGDWQERMLEQFKDKYPRPVLLFYLNHLAWELAKSESVFQAQA